MDQKKNDEMVRIKALWDWITVNKDSLILSEIRDENGRIISISATLPRAKRNVKDPRRNKPL